MASAVLVVAVTHALLPASFRLAPGWSFQLLLAVFLAVLVVGDPGRIDRPRLWLHVVTEVMIAFIAAVNTVSALRLVDDILGRSPFSARQLLLIGGVVWLTNVIVFALWFWDLDGGGAAERAVRSSPARLAFIFPEMAHPDRVGAEWSPQFVDYLTMSFNTATAFSPTDVSAIRPWAKLLSMLEAAVSLVVALLVIARAVNILT